MNFKTTGPVVQWIVRRSPEPDIPVRFWTGLLNKKQVKPAFYFFIVIRNDQCFSLGVFFSISSTCFINFPINGSLYDP